MLRSNKSHAEAKRKAAELVRVACFRVMSWAMTSQAATSLVFILQVREV